MRATQPFAYIVEDLPWQHPIFAFIQEHGPVDDREAFGNFNMGLGFAIYVPMKQVGEVFKTLESRACKGQPNYFLIDVIGRIEKSDTRKVIIEPKGIEYSADTLAVR